MITGSAEIGSTRRITGLLANAALP